jgi:hypothetical protein
VVIYTAPGTQPSRRGRASRRQPRRLLSSVRLAATSQASLQPAHVCPPDAVAARRGLASVPIAASNRPGAQVAANQAAAAAQLGRELPCHRAPRAATEAVCHIGIRLAEFISNVKCMLAVTVACVRGYTTVGRLHTPPADCDRQPADRRRGFVPHSVSVGTAHRAIDRLIKTDWSTPRWPAMKPSGQSWGRDGRSAAGGRSWTCRNTRGHHVGRGRLTARGGRLGSDCGSSDRTERRCRVRPRRRQESADQRRAARRGLGGRAPSTPPLKVRRPPP